MKQFFVKYCIGNALVQFSTVMDIIPGKSASETYSVILRKIKDDHNKCVKDEIKGYFTYITTEDIIILVLTQLN